MRVRMLVPAAMPARVGVGRDWESCGGGGEDEGVLEGSLVEIGVAGRMRLAVVVMVRVDGG